MEVSFFAKYVSYTSYQLNIQVLAGEAYARWQPSRTLRSEEDRSGGVPYVSIGNTT